MQEIEVMKRQKTGIILILCTIFGCSTTPPIVELSESEKIQRDISLGRVLHEKFLDEVVLKKDKIVEEFLKESTTKLIDSSSARLRGSIVEVYLIKQPKISNKFTNKVTAFGLPGFRVYLSTAALKFTKYENEIAALLAIEIAHVELRHVVKRVEDNISRKFKAMGQTQFASDLYSSSIDFFGPNGIFSYTEEENIEAIERAVELVYNIGYDPRGVISVIMHPEIYNLEFGKNVNIYATKARLKIATKAPIRNPITRSASFISIQQRIEAL